MIDLLNKRHALVVVHGTSNSDGYIMIGIVVEGETGYYKTDYNVAKEPDVDKAEAFCAERNETQGLSEADVEVLHMKSMNPKADEAAIRTHFNRTQKRLPQVNNASSIKS